MSDTEKVTKSTRSKYICKTCMDI